MLNGYCLLKPIFTKSDSPLAIEKETEDKSRGIVAYVGKPNKQYQRDEYQDMVDLQVGDEVLYNPNTPLFRLERLSALAQFDGNNLYNVFRDEELLWF